MQNGNERANSRIILKKNTINLGDILNTDAEGKTGDFKNSHLNLWKMPRLFAKLVDYRHWVGLVWGGWPI